MSAALCALYETIKQDPLPYKNLVPSFISILKQVNPRLSTPSAHTLWMRTCSRKPIKHCVDLEHSFHLATCCAGCRASSSEGIRLSQVTCTLYTGKQATSFPACSSALWHILLCRASYARTRW